MFQPGPRNLITDVAGLIVGHATLERAMSGVTVVSCAADWAAGVDVRGGGPGTRETEALAPENLVETKVTTIEDDEAALEAVRQGRTRPPERQRVTDFLPFNPGLLFVPRR